MADDTNSSINDDSSSLDSVSSRNAPMSSGSNPSVVFRNQSDDEANSLHGLFDQDGYRSQEGDDEEDDDSSSEASSSPVPSEVVYNNPTPGDDLSSRSGRSPSTCPSHPSTPSYSDGSSHGSVDNQTHILSCEVPNCHVAEESLVNLVKSHKLPINVYGAIMKWAKEAKEKGYNFEGKTYHTVLHKMIETYGENAGGSPIQSTIYIEGFPPTHVYRFSFLKNVQRLLSDPDIMENALWRYNDTSAQDGVKTYGELNTADWWKKAESTYHGFDQVSFTNACIISFFLPFHTLP